MSLSGLSGVFIGITALAGAAVIFIYKYDFFFGRYYRDGVFLNKDLLNDNELFNFQVFSAIVLLVVLILAIGFGIVFTLRNARKKGLPAWSSSGRRMVINLFVPLVAGGLFCLALLYHGMIYLIAPVTLIFYGLALF